MDGKKERGTCIQVEGGATGTAGRTPCPYYACIVSRRLGNGDNLALGIAEHDEVAGNHLARVHVREHGLIQRVDPDMSVITLRHSTHLMFIFSIHERPRITSKCGSSESMAVWIPVREPTVIGTLPRIWRPEYPPTPGVCCCQLASSQGKLTLEEMRPCRTANVREM